jgi:predicted methyltransferase
MSRHESQVRNDQWCHPHKVIAWMGVKDGQTVGDIAGANGYWGYFCIKGQEGKQMLVHNASKWKALLDH